MKKQILCALILLVSIAKAWPQHVGIGTTSPLGKLHIVADTGIALIGNSHRNTTARIQLLNDTTKNPALDVLQTGRGDGLRINLTNPGFLGLGEQLWKGINVSVKGGAVGIMSRSSNTTAIHGISEADNGAGLVGDNLGGGIAILGRTTSSSTAAIIGKNDGNGAGADEGIGVEGYVVHAGVGIHGRSDATNGRGSGGLFEKFAAFSGVYTNGIAADLEVRHNTEVTTGLSGLRIMNRSTGSAHCWTLYTTGSTGNFSLYYKNSLRGVFNSSTGSYNMISDARFKHDINPITGLTEKVMALQPKSYSYISDSLHRRQLGFLAQEVEPYFPEAVYKSKNDQGTEFYTMDYSVFGVIAIGVIKEQQQRIDNMQDEINELKKLVNEVRRKK
jgi:hypothetical protein